MHPIVDLSRQKNKLACAERFCSAPMLMSWLANGWHAVCNWVNMATALINPSPNPSTPHHQPLPAPSSVARSIVRELKQTGVTIVFTVTGGPLMPFLQACHAERLQTIVCRHETNAAFMAAAYFQSARKPALLALTSGPGAANAVNGLLYALREHCALFVISARPATPKLGRGAVQDLNTARLLAPLTKASEQVVHPKQCIPLTRQLCALALAPTPGPVNLTECNDTWITTVTEHAR